MADAEPPTRKIQVANSRPEDSGRGLAHVPRALMAALALTGHEPLSVYRLMVEEAFGGERRIAATLTAATPLLLTGLAAADRFARPRDPRMDRPARRPLPLPAVAPIGPPTA